MGLRAFLTSRRWLVVLPEPAGRSLEDLATDTTTASVRPLRVAHQASAP
jgi:hypothetical protein